MFPEEETEKSREGTLAHEVCAAYNRVSKLPDGATDEMIEGAELFGDDIATVRQDAHTLHVEERVNCQSVHPDCWGTPDAYTMVPGHLYLWDYKFGHGYVDAMDNWQLLIYAIGILSIYGTATTDDMTVHLRIVQPRNFHPDGPVREWLLTGKEVIAYIPYLRERAALALTVNAPTQTGLHCDNCKARHACGALQDAAYRIADVSGNTLPLVLSSGMVGRELALLEDAAAVLDARIEGLRNDALGRIKSGDPVLGWMTKQGMGREKWVRPVEEVIAIGNMMQIDVEKKGVITPKQAIKAGLPASLVSSYTETPVGEVKLVRDSGAWARKVFQGAK